MRIPSYDDLTPSIPDIGTGETLARVKGILPGTGRRVVAGSVATSTVSRRLEAPPYVGLFACLRSTDASAALVDIARDFSPRLERHGSASVVLDVGGLGRLLGDPETIGRELQRAAASCVRIAIARTHTAARLLAIAPTRFARSGQALTVATGDAVEAVASLTLDALRVLVEDDQPSD